MVQGIVNTTARMVGMKAPIRYSCGEIVSTLASETELGLDVTEATDFVVDAIAEFGCLVITAWELVGRAIGR